MLFPFQGTLRRDNMPFGLCSKDCLRSSVHKTLKYVVGFKQDLFKLEGMQKVEALVWCERCVGCDNFVYQARRV